jgi:hypothetical protein
VAYTNNDMFLLMSSRSLQCTPTFLICRLQNECITCTSKLLYQVIDNETLYKLKFNNDCQIFCRKILDKLLDSENDLCTFL